MKKQMGGIKLITMIGVLVALIIVAFIAIFITKSKDTKVEEGKTTETQISNSQENATSNENINGQEENNTNFENPTNTDFTLAFLKQENNENNMIYSPLSIKYALKMLEEGANGETLNQIKKITDKLNLPNYKSMGNSLSFANSVFIRDSYYELVKQKYIKSLSEKYNAEIIKDKFENANNVNQWIEEKTLGIIKNMLNNSLVQNSNMKMLLINALAIDMEWKLKFDTSKTYGRKFYLADGKEIEATTMSNKTKSNDTYFYLGDKETVLTMPLTDKSNNEFEFVAIMPNKDLKEYVNKLTIEDINNLDKKLKPASETSAGINIKIPKFSFDYDLKLKEDLQSLGIQDAFSEDLADFSNMADTELYVGEALHKANIDFTEKGVKAAAVTVMAMFEKSAIMNPEIPIEIDIDRPFVFLIRDKKTKEIWFVGTMYEQNLWENDEALYRN